MAATLYYAVTGQSPTTSLARKLHNASLTRPKQINPGITDKLNKAILKGMALDAKDRPQSMRAWLKMLEAPKVTPPRIIPWGWFVGILLSYLFIGYILAAFNAFYITKIITGAVAVACPVAIGVGWAEDEAVQIWTGIGVLAAVTQSANWAEDWAGIWAKTWAGGVARFVARFVAVAVTLAAAWAVASAGDELQKSFSKFHTFLILASTSSLGLGLGWLGHRIFNPSS